MTHRAGFGSARRARLAVVGGRRGGGLVGQFHLEVLVGAHGDALGQHGELLGRPLLGGLLVDKAEPADLVGDGGGGGLLADVAEQREAAREVAVGGAELGVLAAERRGLDKGARQS